jgi:hypothetical protein
MAPFSGGMEHQTMSSMGIFNFGIVAHEVAHQWFGDNVTCATWSDIWLNEGFASYSEYLARKYLLPATAAQEVADMHSFAKQEAGSVYVVDTANVNRLFSSALTYNKGASALRVLHYLLGDSMFFKVCKTYQTRFANGNASTQDFNNLVNELSGKNYDYYFSEWIYGNGYPVFNTSWNHKDGVFYLKINQSNSGNGGLFTLPIEILVKRSTGDTLMLVNVKENSTVVSLPVSGVVSSVVFDPNVWILKNSTVLKDASLGGLAIDTWGNKTIYPNPGKGKVWVDPSFDTPVTLEVYDMQGKLCLSTTGRESFDLESLSKGVYVLKFSNQSEEVWVEKYQKD